MKKNAKQSNWFKETDPFIVHETNLESRADVLAEYLTPNDQFFVCNQTKTPYIDLDSYRVEVRGDAVRRPLELRYEDVLALPHRTLPAYLECAGSQRGLYERIMGEKIEGEHWTRWMLGGVGMAEWTGVPLRTILEMAEVQPDAVDVNVQGLDTDAPEGGTNRPMPISKAMDLDTLLVFKMNGEVLPPDHGFPLRVIVPGWIGSNSIKWVGRITVSSSKIWVHRNTNIYVLHGPQWPEEDNLPAKGGPITTLNIKSSLTLPWGARLTAGEQRIHGIARSPHGKITRVEWSDDGGRHWQDARLLGPIVKYGLVHFEFTWNAPAGRHSLMTRATDEAGHQQPMELPFNREGYLFNGVYAHPVNVEA